MRLAASGASGLKCYGRASGTSGLKCYGRGYSWKQCADIFTDSTWSMVKKIPNELKTVLDEGFKIINFIKSGQLN
jgi:hypothetical protein